MPGDKPKFRLIQKKEGEAKWSSCGGAWLRDTVYESYSVSIELPDGTKMKCLMVLNTPFKPKEEPVRPEPKTIDEALGSDEVPF